ncbi:MAG: anaerobic sulfatase maturase [Eubacteriales bacterium]
MQHLTLLIKPASSLCNLRCEYCFYADVSRRREVPSYGIMEEDMLRVLMKRGFEAASESISFVFQGGEPTVAGLDFFRRAVAYQKTYNHKNIAVYNTIQTNGALLDGEWADFFRENNFLVGVSLDGYRALHDRYRKTPHGEGTFDKTVHAIELLKNSGVAFNILCVVTRDAARDPVGVYNALKKYGYLQFIPMIDDFGGEQREFSLQAEDYGDFLVAVFDKYAEDILRGKYVSIRDFDSYINMLKGLPPSSCAMQGKCGGYFVVESDGSVYPCDFYVTDEYRIGNIVHESLDALAQKETARAFIARSAEQSAQCRRCRWFPICRGGCRRYREPFPSPSKFCAAYKKFFDTCYGKMVGIVRLLNRYGEM